MSEMRITNWPQRAELEVVGGSRREADVGLK